MAQENDNGHDNDNVSLKKEESSLSNEQPHHHEQRKCEECKNKDSVYQCPGCNIRTCSLECCKSHKQRTQCDGKRNRGAFLPLSRMTDSSMRSDYFFLEEALNHMPSNSSSSSNNNKRTKTESSLPAPGSSNNSNMSKKARRLANQAERRGTTLQIMPPMMERRKSNNSWYCAPRDMITWRVELVIYHPEQGKTEPKTIFFQISETEENLMDQVSSKCEKGGISLAGGEYRLLLKQLPSSAKNPRYTLIHPQTDNLKTLLKGRTVVEHPTLYCVPVEREKEFPLGTEQITEIQTEDDPLPAGI